MRYSISTKDGDMKISLGSMTVTKGKRQNSIYILDWKTVIGSTDAITEDGTKLWHLTLVHVGEKGL